MVNDEKCKYFPYRRGILIIIVVVLVFQLYYFNHDSGELYGKFELNIKGSLAAMHRLNINVSIITEMRRPKHNILSNISVV